MRWFVPANGAGLLAPDLLYETAQGGISLGIDWGKVVRRKIMRRLVCAANAGLFVRKLLRVAHQFRIGFARIILAVQYKLFRAERLSESNPNEAARYQR